jgi:hypothetical protein
VITGVTAEGNVARSGRAYGGSGFGGAVEAGGTLTDAGGTYRGNQSGTQHTQDVRGHGGALAGGTVRLARTTLAGNSAAGRGGGAWSAGALTATGATVTGNHGALHGGGLGAGGDVVLTGTGVRDNDVVGYGFQASGAGVDAGGALRLTRAVVSGNRAAARFQAGIIGGGPSTARGGGAAAAGAVTAVASTVSGNVLEGWERTSEPTPRAEQVTGAGLYAGTTADLTNVTVSGNAARVNLYPGTPYTRGAVSADGVRLVHATLSGNTVAGLLDGTTPPEAGTLQTSTLESLGSVVVPGPGQRTCTGPVTAGPASYTVVGDATCGLAGPGVLTDASGAALGAPADNGGPVPTQVPGPGSVLLDAVPSSPLRTDARGVTRPQGPASDIGAVEVER